MVPAAGGGSTGSEPSRVPATGVTGRWGPSVLALLVDPLLPAEAPPDGGPRYPSASERGVDRDVIEPVATLPARERA